jgi:hypothetical protein
MLEFVAAYPNVLEANSWVDGFGKTIRSEVVCHNGSTIYIWRDCDRDVYDITVETPDLDTVTWPGGGTLLVDQPIESLLSLIRMVAKEGVVA